MPIQGFPQTLSEHGKVANTFLNWPKSQWNTNKNPLFADELINFKNEETTILLP